MTKDTIDRFGPPEPANTVAGSEDVRCGGGGRDKEETARIVRVILSERPWNTGFFRFTGLLRRNLMMAFTLSLALASLPHWPVAVLWVAAALWLDRRIISNGIDLNLADRVFVETIVEGRTFDGVRYFAWPALYDRYSAALFVGLLVVALVLFSDRADVGLQGAILPTWMWTMGVLLIAESLRYFLCRRFPKDIGSDRVAGGKVGPAGDIAAHGRYPVGAGWVGFWKFLFLPLATLLVPVTALAELGNRGAPLGLSVFVLLLLCAVFILAGAAYHHMKARAVSRKVLELTGPVDNGW